MTSRRGAAPALLALLATACSFANVRGPGIGAALAPDAPRCTTSYEAPTGDIIVAGLLLLVAYSLLLDGADVDDETDGGLLARGLLVASPAYAISSLYGGAMVVTCVDARARWTRLHDPRSPARPTPPPAPLGGPCTALPGGAWTCPRGLMCADDRCVLAP